MAQNLPATDSFSGTDFGQNIIGWLGALPSDDSLDDPYYQIGILQSGYPEGASGRQITPLTEVPLGWMRREVYPTYQEVTLYSYKRLVQGTVQDQQRLSHHAVFARITAGTLQNNAGTTVGQKDLTCYVLTRERDATPGLYVHRLIRYNAGTPTVLTSSDPRPPLGGDNTTPFGIRLRVYESGGQVHLQGAVSLKGQPFFDDPNLAYTDGSGITGTGRVGFAMDGEWKQGAPQESWVSIATSFEARELNAAGADQGILFRDEFQRSRSYLGKDSTDDIGLFPGNMLGADHSGGQLGNHFTGNDLRAGATGQTGEGLQVLQFGAGSLGGGVDLDGVDDHLQIKTSGFAFANPGNKDVHRISICVWARIDTNRDGNEIYSSYRPSTFQRLHFGLRPVADIGGQAAARFEVRLGDDTIASPWLQTFYSAGFVIADYLGEMHAWTLTYKANKDFSTGDGELRLYVGRNGSATLLDTIPIPFPTQPLFPQLGFHYIGRRGEYTGTATETYMDGEVDRVDVFYEELDADQVAEASYEQHGTTWPAEYKHEAGWLFDGLVSSQYPAYFENNPSGDGGDFLPINGAADVDGELPAIPPTRIISWATRPQLASEGQHRSLYGKLGAQFDIFGILVRGVPDSSPGQGLVYSGYRLDVGVGTPAPIRLFRVRAGVDTLIARQDPTGGTVNVSSGSFVKAQLEAFQPYDPTGAVQLTVRVGGTLVELIPESAGVLGDLTGSVVDTDALRILPSEGDVVGFHCMAAGADVFLDEWSTETPSASADVISDLANVAIPEEVDTSVGHLELVDIFPEDDWGVEIDTARNSHQRTMHGGRIKRANMDTRSRRYLRVSKPYLDAELYEPDGLADAFKLLGSSGPIIVRLSTWVPRAADGYFVLIGDLTFEENEGTAGRSVVFRLEERFSSQPIPDHP